MYVSRLTFHTLPGKTQEVEEKLITLRDWVAEAGGLSPRVMRTHYGSLGAPDLVFEQEVENPDAFRATDQKGDKEYPFPGMGQTGSRALGAIFQARALPNHSRVKRKQRSLRQREQKI